MDVLEEAGSVIMTKAALFLFALYYALHGNSNLTASNTNGFPSFLAQMEVNTYVILVGIHGCV